MHISSKRSASSPISTSPRMIGPASKSMTSLMRVASVLLLAILSTGVTGLPVGVPSPVVNMIRLAPEPASAVVDSTSLPGEHSRLRPARVCGSV